MARHTTTRIVMASLALTALVACQTAKSANPLSPSVAGPIPGVEITAPKPLEPLSGAELVAEGTPTTLLIENASTSGQRSLWMQVEVATDADFRQVLHQADRVALGSNGRTTHKIPDPLGAGATYYWRARALDGSNTGPYSAVANFRMVEPVRIDPPAPIQPAGSITTNGPQFKVQTPRFSGTTSIVIRFEVGTAPGPSSLIAVVTAQPGSDGTTSMSLGGLPWNTTFYWRAYATDLATESAPSPTVSFRTPPEPVPTPAPAPAPNLPPSTAPVSGPRTISVDEALQIIRSVHDAEGWNLGASSSREQRISFWLRAVSTIHYGHGRYNPKGRDSNWCVKDAGGGRPLSDDVIARCNSRDAYDLIGGAGANGYTFRVDSIGRLPGDQNVYPPPQSALPR